MGRGKSFVAVRDACAHADNSGGSARTLRAVGPRRPSSADGRRSNATGSGGVDASAPVVTLAPASRPAGPGPLLAAFTVDVEDWYQSCVDYDAPITERVVRTSTRVLGVLDERGVKGTFFVQGRVAETFPRLVRRSSPRATRSSRTDTATAALRDEPRELRDELERARETVEDASGTPVTAFRAQDFSIRQATSGRSRSSRRSASRSTPRSSRCESRRYGIAGWEVAPHRRRTLERRSRSSRCRSRSGRSGRWRVPVAGGGYFRVLPGRCSNGPPRRSSPSGRPAVVYCHPYEFNATELDEYAATCSRRLRFSPGPRPTPSFAESRPAPPRRASRSAGSTACSRLGACVNIVFLTTDDPLYLPAFFERVLGTRGDDAGRIRRSAALQGAIRAAAAWRYFRTFGLGATRHSRRASLRASSGGSRLPRLRAARRSVRERPDVNAPEFLDELRALGTELVVSVSCPQIFERALIDLPPKGCLNIHGAILPEYRGVMPSFWMLANGRDAGGGLRSTSSTSGSTQANSAVSASSRSPPRRRSTNSCGDRRRSRPSCSSRCSPRRERDRRTRPVDLTKGSYYSWPDRDAVGRFRARGRRLWRRRRGSPRAVTDGSPSGAEA